MLRYMVINEQGKYRNSTYRDSLRHGKWRDRENARLYKSMSGIRSSFSYSFTGRMLDVLGMSIPPRPSPYDPVNTPLYLDACREVYKRIHKLSPAKWVAFMEESGYTFVTVEV